MNIITVSGLGKVVVSPDVATVSFSVITNDKKSSKAVEKNSERMEELMSVLKNHGVKSEDRFTSGFGVSPIWTNTRSQAKINGYQCQNAITFKVRNITEVGEIISDLGDAEAGTLSFTYGVENSQQQEDTARELAYKDALRKAEIYCKASGSALLGVHEISEQSNMGFGNRKSMAMMAPACSPDGAVPLECGKQDISISLHVVFNLAM